MAGLTRAVIDLSKDITAFMPKLTNHIKGAVHNRINDTMAFRFDDHAIIIEHGQMIIMNQTDIQKARTIYARFNEIIDSFGEKKAT